MNKAHLSTPDVCPQCGQEFHCSKSARCWCFGHETTPEVLEYLQDRWQSCLCPDCLEALAKAISKAKDEQPCQKSGDALA